MKKLTLTLLLSLFLIPAISQNDDWIRVFWVYKNVTSHDLLETYDKGYLILATVRPDPGGGAETWTWLIKTDINGEILWEKKIGDIDVIGGFHDIHQTPDGGYVLAGATTLLDNTHGDTFFMKLNACGEKEWCRIFHLAGENTNFDFGLSIYPSPDDDGYIALVQQWGNEFVPGVFKGIWLFRLDSMGNSIWIKNVFNEVHPDAWNEIPENMFIAEDGTLIITGTIIYNDFGMPYGWDKPFVFATEPDGTEKWWAIMGQDETHFGLGNHSIGDIHGNIYTTGWYEDYEDGSSHYFPSLHKTDKYGNKIFSKYLIDSTPQANSFCINIMGDTVVDVGGVWYYLDEPVYSYIARADTNGNLISEKQVWETIFGFSNSIKTFDDKELFVGKFKDDDNYYKIHLHKFNSDLEYDTIYTQPFEYDYMCNDLPIISDTIGIDDCDIWTGLPGEIEYRLAQYLVVYPNPARDNITVRLPRYTAEEREWGPFTSMHFNAKYFKNSKLLIYDVFGRQVKQIPLKNQEGVELKIDVSSLTSGIYLINLFENDKKMASGKFVVKH